MLTLSPSVSLVSSSRKHHSLGAVTVIALFLVVGSYGERLGKVELTKLVNGKPDLHTEDPFLKTRTVLFRCLGLDRP